MHLSTIGLYLFDTLLSIWMEMLRKEYNKEIEEIENKFEIEIKMEILLTNKKIN